MIERNITTREQERVIAAGGPSSIHDRLFTEPGHHNYSQQSSPAEASKENAAYQGGRLTQLPGSEDPFLDAAYEESEGDDDDGTGALQERMQNARLSPIKRVTQKFGASKAWIKGAFKSKTDKQKQPEIPARPSAEEAQIGTATKVTMTPVKAPYPTPTSHRQQDPLASEPIYQGCDSFTPTRRAKSSGQRTTRAEMEGYD